MKNNPAVKSPLSLGWANAGQPHMTFPNVVSYHFLLFFLTTDHTDDTDWVLFIRVIRAIRGQNEDHPCAQGEMKNRKHFIGVGPGGNHRQCLYYIAATAD